LRSQTTAGTAGRIKGFIGEISGFINCAKSKYFPHKSKKNGAPAFVAGRPVHSRSRSMRQARIN
jgi:hypothetical protein